MMKALLFLGVALIALLAGAGVLNVSAVQDLKWEIKAVLLSVVGFSLIVSLLVSYEKAKRYIPYVLAVLISETGFAYEIKPGYFTSANEVLTVAILLIWVSRKMLVKKDASPRPYFLMQLRIFLGVAMAGVATAYWIFGVSPLNIFIVFKSYTLYLFYLFLIPDCIRSEEELGRVILFMMVMSLIPLYYGMSGSMAIMSSAGRERLSVEGWGALNIFVGYILPVFFLAFGRFFEERSKLLRVLIVCYMATITYVLLLSQTRTAWAALLFGVGLFALFSKRKLVAGAVALILVAGIVFSPAAAIVERRIYSETLDPDTSLQERYGRWEGAWATAKTYPLTGSGWGGVLPLVSGVSGDRVGGTSLDLLPLWHNAYLEVLSQVGFPGLLAFILLWGKIITTEGKNLFFLPRLKRSTAARGIFIAVIACLIYALAEQQFYKIETASHSYFIAGLLLAAGNIVGLTKEQLPKKGSALS